ncbi:hypothetical protein LUZ63_015884 [Rhynchospora breviuscula]|uniref:Uncharacterized protein n=1 Tax=Rhynchospora breviuscula TaxID=2022672 RepID=A0A9Q0CDW5_9POAL|nr:hypothetical protein LUZ63_015884 [Rhynchospora breviuscula]
MDHHMEMECDDSSDVSKEANSKLESNPNLTKPQLEEKRNAVHAELARVTKLPSNSSYAIHRVRVLHKLLHLLSIQQRNVSQDEELELLFASLSLTHPLV